MSFPGSVLINQEDIVTTYSSKILPLGTRGYTRDGRVYRFAKNGATALKAGLLCQSAAPIAGQLGLKSGSTKLIANSTKATLLNSSTGIFTTANAFADGYLFCYSSSTAVGGGVYAQIKSNTTQTATSTGKVVFNFVSGGLYGASTIVGSTKASWGVFHNVYNKVIVKPAGLKTAIPVGVPNRAIAAAQYFWLQTWGPCPCRMTTACKIGDPVGPSSGATAGVMDGFASTVATSAAASLKWSQIKNLMDIGNTMQVSVAGERRLVWLKLAP